MDRSGSDGVVVGKILNHATGCLHYQLPTEGVEPEDMIRHTMGEDLGL